jgi:hypothetical protein
VLYVHPQEITASSPKVDLAKPKICNLKNDILKKRKKKKKNDILFSLRVRQAKIHP